MNRNPRYDILFEPVRIGPVTAPNRFYCAPHALGTGNQMPHTRAAMREVRAEGGWGVVNTGYCSIHPSSDDSPLPNCRLWDDEDIKVHALMVDAVHRHGALAGVELWHGGSGTGNRLSRRPLISASGVSYDLTYPGWMNLTRSRPMDRQDIREFRRWHVDAAKRARSAGFDIVYIYAGMNFGPYQFLLPWMNKRTDEYGGSLQNRTRLMREIVEDMKEAVGETCAVALRFSTDELLQVPGETLESEAHEIISMLSDVPDLWDVKASSWTVEAASARFSEQGAAFSTSSARPGHQLRIRSCRKKSTRVGRTRSASALAAIFVCPPIMIAYHCAVPRTRPWARSGGAAGIRNAYRPVTRTKVCW
jgi:dimethylamine/trimethylamine dehydrogenase